MIRTRSLWLAIVCIVLSALFFFAAISYGLVYQTDISPNRQRIVYRSDDVEAGRVELYSIPAAGGLPTRLSMPLGPTGNVLDFRIAPDSTRVVYKADLTTDEALDLYSVPITGGASTRLSMLPADHDTFEFRIAPDSGHVVYRQGQTSTGRYDLRSSPTLGPANAARRVSRSPMVGAPKGDFVISRNSARVLYRADAEVYQQYDLYTVPIGGGASVRINAALAAEQDVTTFELHGEGEVWYQVGTVWYVAPVDGGVVLRELFADDFESGNRGRWR